jgi:hypothetical protein
MRGDDFGFVWNLQRVQHIGGFFHGGPIGLAAHDDTYFDLSHAVTP